jgi:hypothetical protein
VEENVIRWLSAALAFAVCLHRGVARADPVVVVHVRRQGAPAEGTVFLRDGHERITGVCTTRDGTCRIPSIEPGRHYVWVRLPDGRESVERPVVLPPDGEVTLIVAAP